MSISIYQFIKKQFMQPKKNLPICCPSCGEELHVHVLTCPECATRIEGDYGLPEFLRLADEEQRFLLDFVKCGGSLKELAAQRGVSYPTVRNRLDELIEHLKTLES